MKARKCKFPFSQYVGYKQTLPSGRTYIYMWDRKTDKRRLISLARYRLSVKLGRLLGKHEHVDHKDDDKTNDKLDNLQILSPLANNKKKVIQQGLTRKIMTLTCPNCRKRFTRFKNQVEHRVLAGKKPACSRSCALRYVHASFG